MFRFIIAAALAALLAFGIVLSGLLGPYASVVSVVGALAVAVIAAVLLTFAKFEWRVGLFLVAVFLLATYATPKVDFFGERVDRLLAYVACALISVSIVALADAQPWRKKKVARTAPLDISANAKK